MDFNNPPSIFSPQQVTIPAPTGRLVQSISQGRRALLILNRSAVNVWLGSDSSVNSTTGFLLRPDEGIAVATAAEIWATPGQFHVITLAH